MVFIVTVAVTTAVCCYFEERQEDVVEMRLINVIYYHHLGSQDSLLVELRTRDRKVSSSNPGRSGGRISSPELTLCADSHSVSAPPPS